MPTRRRFLAALGAAATVGTPESLGARRIAPGRGGADGERDEPFWSEIRREFDVDRSIVNLNNGGVSPAPRVVQEALARDIAYSNRAPAYTMWRELEPRIEEVRARLAGAFGCDPEEMAITRNASESLETCLLGLDLGRGDEVLTTTQDYPRMLATLAQRARRDGIVVKAISLPVPGLSADDVVARFERAVTPRTKAILVCHVINLTGQILPVARICALGRERGLEVIVDGAHAFAHFPFTRDELGCDYYATSLHKWLMAPIGTGFLYVRRPKIERLWPLMAAEAKQSADIRKFEEIGTHPAANHNAILEAIAFHERIGGQRKAARLRHLKGLWAERLGRLRGFKMLAPAEPAESCGLATASFEGADPVKLAGRLWAEQRILVTPIVHDEFRGVRITPSVYTAPEEIDRFCAAVERALATTAG